jgi:hypothetical protein
MKRGWNHVRGRRVYSLNFNYILKGWRSEVAYSSTQQKNPTDGKTQQPKNPLKNQKPKTNSTFTRSNMHMYFKFDTSAINFDQITMEFFSIPVDNVFHFNLMNSKLILSKVVFKDTICWKKQKE